MAFVINKIISGLFFALFIVTPFIWWPDNHELFEYNKMMFVYLITVLITGFWVIRMINERRVIYRFSILDIPILLFLGANIASTVYSIDPHTSWWGYYSRSNGGLLSIISYTLLYFGFMANISKKTAIKLLASAILAGGGVALYAIPEHLGISPSCVILTGQWSADCWVQDVQSRVFATLGQPNWLAAYLGMLIFPSLSFVYFADDRIKRSIFFITTLVIYLAFTFTYSRGATLGVLIGLGVLLIGCLIYEVLLKNQKDRLKRLLIFGGLLLGLVSINILYGSALTGEFRLIKTNAPPPRPGISTNVQVGTQLENGGTESGQIRLIVWKGALDIYRHYPVFGSGVETFAYAYYQFRPQSHNLVSEWDFLYNKAHNEFLNYLANTGTVGIASYLLLITTFLIWSVVRVIKRKSEILVILAGVASLVSYHIQNFFGFSVVIIAVFFYLFPAIALVYSQSFIDIKFSAKIFSPFRWLFSVITSRALYRGVLISFVVIVVWIFFLKNLNDLWLADTLFASGSNYSDAGNVGKGYNLIQEAVIVNPREPLYRSELGYVAAAASVALQEEDATWSGKLKEEAIAETERVLLESPKNVSFIRTAIRSYFQLSLIDDSFKQKTVEVTDKAISLAPTDAKLYYNKAIILGQYDQYGEAIKALSKAIELKPNYREAYLTQGIYYKHFADISTNPENKAGFIKQAKESYEQVLKLIPNDPEALERIKELEVSS